VVFGAGQVGALLAERLLAAGKNVRVARRSAGGVAAGAEAIQGDATDPEFCLRATEGASAIYHCMNPGYDSGLWARFVPALMQNLIAAAVQTGARLVVLDNLYMYGRPAGVIDETTPFSPASRKGAIRARVSDLLSGAQQRGEVSAAVARASDFFGPGGVGTHFADRFWKPALAGKTVRVLFDPNARHSYNYIPDVAAGLARLGLAEDDILGRTWMLPTTAAQSARELTDQFSRVLGREIRLAQTPRLLVKTLGLVAPIVREVDEMLHQWEVPFVIDDSAFRERFECEATPVAEAAQATVDWAKAAFD
jgi:nucleoside-diphosphate-sugar epimerase